MTGSELAGVDLKIGRAKRHLADLKKAIGAVLNESNGHRFAIEHDPQTGKHVCRVYRLPRVNPDWNLVVGEIFFNLRSALDHLAWQLVLLDHQTPREETQFPIRETPFSKKGNLIGANLQPGLRNSTILKLVEEVQPYRGPEGEPAPFDKSPLWRLKKLNNIDKHRVLLIVVLTVNISGMWWAVRSDEPPPDVEINAEPLEKEGAPVAWFDFHGNEPPENFDPHPSLAVALREPDVPALWLVPITEFLSGLCWWVEWNIVGIRFRPLFAPSAVHTAALRSSPS